MQKIIIQGTQLPSLPKIDNSVITLKGKEILEYFEKPHAANEIFINAHGNTATKEQLLSYLSKKDSISEKDKETLLLNCFHNHDEKFSSAEESTSLPHLFVELFEKEDNISSTEELINPFLSRIAQNTERNLPNIVHIFSCQSGAAQHYIDRIDGNVVLCTYRHAANTSIKVINDRLFNNYNQSNNIIDFIVKNLPLLSALGFSICYKLDDIKYSLTFDANDIKTVDLTGAKEFIQNQYHKVVELQNFDKNHLKIFSEYSVPAIKEYTDNELKGILNSILNFNINNLTSTKIEDFLKIEGLNIYIALKQTIAKGDMANLKLLLNYPQNISSLSIRDAIESNNPEIVKMIFDKIDKVENVHFDLATKGNNPEIIEMISNKLNKPNNHTSTSELKIIQEKTSEIKTILNKDTNINILDFNSVINSDELNNTEKLDFLKKISNFTTTHFGLALQSWKLSDIDKLDILKIILDDMKEAGSNLLELVKSTPNPEIVKMVKSYVYHTNSEPIENTEHNSSIENNHEVIAVGEVYSEG